MWVAQWDFSGGGTVGNTVGARKHLRHERLHRALSAGDTLLLPIHARNTVVDELRQRSGTCCIHNVWSDHSVT